MNWNLVSLSALMLLALNVNAADDAQIKRGQYLSTAGDCVACHSVPGGKPFAGGLALPTPIGEIIATNITPSKTAGIGNYSLEQFSDALRKGVRADGQHLYPAMPYTAYAKVSDEDIKDMYAYFMNAVEPVETPTRATDLPFPFNIRLSMAAWNLLFLDNSTFVADTGRDPEWNRGAYLVQGLTHCSTCHTPRNLLMAEAVDHSLQNLSDSDLKAIAVYLKALPAQHNPADSKPVYALGQATDELNSIRGVELPANGDKMTGAQIYDAYCSSCHQAQAQGSFEGALPSLLHNTAVGRSNPANLVMVILEGVKRGADGQDIRMQGFAKTLSDQQVATLATWLTEHYGNPQVKVSAAQVKQTRAGGPVSHLAALAQGAIAAGVIVLILLLVWRARRKRRG